MDIAHKRCRELCHSSVDEIRPTLIGVVVHAYVIIRIVNNPLFAYAINVLLTGEIEYGWHCRKGGWAKAMAKKIYAVNNLP